MDDTDFYLQQFKGAAVDRVTAYRKIYDGLYSDNQAELSRTISKRKRKRIRLIKSIIGTGHRQILELGCGLGELTLELAGQAHRVIGTDVSPKAIQMAQTRKKRLLPKTSHETSVDFHPMGATDIEYDAGSFDWVLSTSLIEHLYPDDIQVHLTGVHRVLREGGRYLVWAPNRLGHHGDRDIHLSMFSYRELVEEMSPAGFKKFYTTFFNFSSLVNAGFKISLENWLTALRIKTFWSHLGVRNILLVAEK